MKLLINVRTSRTPKLTQLSAATMMGVVIDRLHEGHKQANLKEITESKRKKMGEQLAHMEIIRTELQEKAQNFEKDIGEFKARGSVRSSGP